MERFSNITHERRLEYFREYWREFTENTDNISSQRLGFVSLEQDCIDPIVYNLSGLFRLILDEIEQNELFNKYTKELFSCKIAKINELQLKSLDFIKSDLDIIKKFLNDKNDLSNLIDNINCTLNKIADFRLGKECVDELIEMLIDDTAFTKNDKDNIKHLIHFIVFELQNKGFSCPAIHKLVNGMDIIDKIQSIKSYFNQQAKSIRFIFQVKGIKDFTVNIGDIEIYNPSVNNLINENDAKQYDETFGKKNNTNIAVKVNLIQCDKYDIYNAKYEAIHKANEFFDFLVANNFYVGIGISIDTTLYYIIDDENNKVISNIGLETIPYYKTDFVKYESKIGMQYYENIKQQTELLKIDRQIIKSLSWKRRALETMDYNESILWNWIVMENLFHYNTKNTNIIFAIAPKILAMICINYFTRHIFYKIQTYRSKKMFPTFSRLENMQQAVQNIEIGMTYSSVVNFINEICASSHIDKDSFFYEQLHNLPLIFNEKFIKNYERQVEQKIKFLSVMRNKIAHNAHIEYNSTIIYYKNFADYMSANILGYFINKRLDGFIDSGEIINLAECEYQKTLTNIEKNNINSIPPFL